MQRYHFNIEDGEAFQDRDGTELSNLEAARVEAVKILAQALMAKPEEFWRTECLEVQVTDRTGLALFSVRAVAHNAPVLRHLAKDGEP